MERHGTAGGRPPAPARSLSDAYARSPDELARRLGTDLQRGLEVEEAARRHRELGANLLPRLPPEPALLRLLRHLREPMTLLLVGAASLSLLGLGDLADGIAILAIVALNTFIGLLQEGRAAQALAALETMVTRRARVVRDGVTAQVSSAELVPGDLVLLAAGDGVPADLRLVGSSSVSIDESVLTGESLPVDKRVAVDIAASASLGERVTMAYTGTLVTRGAASGVVVAIGAATEMGAIAAKLGGAEAQTPIQRELGRLTLVLGVVAVLVAGVVFFMLARGAGDVGAVSLHRAFLVAVALAVAAVPEGLATVVTLGLANGVRRMARRGAIVRRLPAVETLGATTVILTDKTGTLTENRMRVGAVSLGLGPFAALEALAEAAGESARRVMALCNDAELSPPSGDPLEVALLDAVGDGEVEALRRDLPRRGGLPFDADTKLMTTLHESAGGALLLVKGAPETVLELCDAVRTADGGATRLAEPDRASLLERCGAAADEGMRLLALAEKAAAVGAADTSALTLVGLVGLRDPVRPEAREAISQARAAGIDIVMVTGDHAGTARAIAAQVGLVDDARTAVLTGRELELHGVPEDPLAVRVYARIAPHQKLLLAEALQRRGHVVAVTGDGVNDGPALRVADIGVAMGGRGTDVAREASDLVITDDNLATIVAAVREGRGIYENIRKVVEYMVAGNLSEILVVVGSLVLFPGLSIPLLPLQLLWLNLLTDGLPALALGVDAIAGDVMQKRPRARAAHIVSARRLLALGGRAVVVASAPLLSLWVTHELWGATWEHARGVMFSVLVGAHLLFAFVVRRRGGRAPFENAWLVGAAVLGLLLQNLLLLWAPAQRLFSLSPLSGREWLLVLALGLVPFLVIAGLQRLADLVRPANHGARA